MIYLTIFAFLTAIILITGIILMAFGGKINKKYAGKLMSLRVLMQLSAILLLVGFGYFYGIR